MIIARRRLVSSINSFLKNFEKEFISLNKIEIHSRNILYNYDLIRSAHPKKEIWPVLKGNAYGHGLRELTQILKYRNFTYAVVDAYFEALRIWEHSDQQVLLIGSIHPNNFKSIDFKKCAIVVQDLESIKTLGKLKQNVRVHLKINTGMNRQGIEPNQVSYYIKTIQKQSNLDIEGICSHFADADNIDQSFTNKQEATFKKSVQEIHNLDLDPKYIHIAATSGTSKLSDDITNVIRLGLGLYGYNPLQEKTLHNNTLGNLEPSLRMKACITKTRTIEQGEKIGYNTTFTANSRMRIGVISCGYHEGIPRFLSDKGYVNYSQEELPIVGRISMNLIVVDLKDTKAKAWEEVEIISPNQDLKNSFTHIAQLGKTNVYEIMSGLDESIRRIII